MSNITDRNVIDSMAVVNRVLKLFIIDTLPWEYGTRNSHAQAMSAKINDYLNFIGSGQIYEHRSKEEYDSVMISITAQYSYSRFALDILEKLKIQINNIGICGFEWNHGLEEADEQQFDDGFSDDFTFDIEKVYPRLKKNWAKKPLEEVSLMNYETKDGTLNAPMIRIRESFVLIFVQDVGKGYVYLDYDMLPDDINIDWLSDKAFQNLTRDITYRMVDGKEQGIYGLVAGGDFEAEVLLCNGIWQECAKMLGGDIVFTIPTKDMVIFALADDKKSIKKLFNMSREIFERNREESPELLFCKDVFRYSVSDDEWEITKKCYY